MDSDIETVLSRARDKAVARFQILPPVGGEGDAVPVCYVVICPGLMQAFRTLLREAQAEAVTIITGPRVSIFQNIVTYFIWSFSGPRPACCHWLLLLYCAELFFLPFSSSQCSTYYSQPLTGIKTQSFYLIFFFSFPFFHLLSSLSSFFLIFISFWHLRLHNSIDWVNFEILISLFSI